MSTSRPSTTATTAEPALARLRDALAAGDWQAQILAADHGQAWRQRWGAGMEEVLAHVVRFEYEQALRLIDPLLAGEMR